MVRIGNWMNPGYVKSQFSPAEWAIADNDARGRMADDLLSRYPISGMTRNEVSELLGPPDEDQVKPSRYRYFLGNRGRNPDLQFPTTISLIIRFDERGVAIDAGIYD